MQIFLVIPFLSPSSFCHFFITKIWFLFIFICLILSNKKNKIKYQKNISITMETDDPNCKWLHPICACWKNPYLCYQANIDPAEVFYHHFGLELPWHWLSVALNLAHCAPQLLTPNSSLDHRYVRNIVALLHLPTDSKKTECSLGDWNCNTVRGGLNYALWRELPEAG